MLGGLQLARSLYMFEKYFGVLPGIIITMLVNAFDMATLTRLQLDIDGAHTHRCEVGESWNSIAIALASRQDSHWKLQLHGLGACAWLSQAFLIRDPSVNHFLFISSSSVAWRSFVERLMTHSCIIVYWHLQEEQRHLMSPSQLFKGHRQHTIASLV